MKLKVILLRDVRDLGDRDEIVDVSQGHAQNYLIPQGLAVLASPDTICARDDRKKAAVRAAETELATIQKLAERIDGFDITIQVKVSDSGTLYAAVTPEKISEALIQNHYAVDSAWISLPDPIKKEGEYDVQLDFPHGLEAMIRVIVQRE